MTIGARRWIDRGAFLAGVLAAAGLVAAGSVPAGERPLRAGATVSASATGGLAVAPESRLLTTRALTPGGPSARGRVSVLNQTSAPVSVLVRADGPKGELGRELWLELRTGDAPALRTSLARLRRWRPLSGSIVAQRRARVKVRVWLPARVDEGYEARRETVTLEFIRRGARG